MAKIKDTQNETMTVYNLLTDSMQSLFLFATKRAAKKKKKIVEREINICCFFFVSKDQ
jgi:hypothetical protein